MAMLIYSYVDKYNTVNNRHWYWY